MKLRIKGNSLRLRLLRSEVERLAAAGVVSDEVRFGPLIDQVLRYSIAASDGVEEITVQCSDNQILVLLPESVVMEWTGSDKIGVETSQQIDENNSLSVLIEKDFICVDRPGDPDRADAFPNPVLQCKGVENEQAV